MMTMDQTTRDHVERALKWLEDESNEPESIAVRIQCARVELREALDGWGRTLRKAHARLN